MTDIVERLRKLNLAALRLEADNEATTIAEAGLEILRLRSELEQCQQPAFNAMEWQPIETAPTTPVILYFEQTKSRMPLPAKVDVGRAASFMARRPTHWMPLPPPPQEGKP